MNGGPRFNPEQRNAFAELYRQTPKPVLSWRQKIRDRFRRDSPCSVPEFTQAELDAGVKFDGCTCLHDETPA